MRLQSLHSIYALWAQKEFTRKPPVSPTFPGIFERDSFFPPAPNSGLVVGRVTNLEKYRCHQLPVIPRGKP